jgi:hypothetical protein
MDDHGSAYIDLFGKFIQEVFCFGVIDFCHVGAGVGIGKFVLHYLYFPLCIGIFRTSCKAVTQDNTDGSWKCKTFSSTV